MPTHREHLPQLDGDLFLTDGGIETDLIFHDGLDLPLFAAFTLLGDDEGVEALRRYYRPYIQLARGADAGFVLESPTWRASPRWAEELGYSSEQLERLNRRAIDLMAELRSEDSGGAPVVISGCIGPQGDGYDPEVLLDAGAAQDYHSTQIATFADTSADMVTALTLTYADEAIGIVRAAIEAGIPAAISFTVETDGRLPDGSGLGEAIELVERETDRGAAYFMVNCAHPTHFADVLDPNTDWAQRIQGFRPNASTMSHAELDETPELDEGDPVDLGDRYAGLRAKLPRLNVLGGCCGTDSRHVAEIRDRWLATA